MKAKSNEKRQATKNRPSGGGATEAEQLGRAIDWCLDDSMFVDLGFHGNTKWSARFLIALSVLTAWGEHRRMTDSFEEACKLSQRLLGVVAIRTYQGMMRALVRYTEQLLPVVWQRLQMLTEKACPEQFRIGRWVPLAVDGSRFSTPRTLSNEKAFAAKNFGKGGRGKNRTKWKDKNRRSKKLCHPVKPQIWLTLIWHMGTKLPWCWKTGRSTSSERHHLIDMIRCVFSRKRRCFAATPASPATNCGQPSSSQVIIS